MAQRNFAKIIQHPQGDVLLYLTDENDEYEMVIMAVGDGGISISMKIGFEDAVARQEKFESISENDEFITDFLNRVDNPLTLLS